MEKWIDKTAIVTGASAGIGAAIVRDFVKHGINVIALARRAEKLEALQRELNNEKGKVIPMRCDVSEKSSIDSTFKEIAKKFGSAQILVNNAGVAISGAILSGDDDDEVDKTIVNTIQTNFVGLVRMTRKAYRLMEKAGDYGIIINIGSVVSHVVPFTPFNTNVYSGTKFGVRAVTETIRHELIKSGNLKVRICEICPGAVDTDIFDSGGWTKNTEKDKFLEKMGMVALRDSDVSQTVLFMLMLPYTVNVTEMIVKPTGEKF